MAKIKCSLFFSLRIILIVLLSTGAIGVQKMNAAPVDNLYFSVLTLNLHGYHPMYQKQRYIREDSGRFYGAWSHLHFFTESELIAGNENRIRAFAKDIKTVQPSFVFMQEVGAGNPHSDKNCDTFYHNDRGSPWNNTAHRLDERLPNYQSSLACRGNLGWQTHSDTYDNKTILRYDGSDLRTIFHRGNNPYPRGILIEGFSLLVRTPWKIDRHFSKNIPVNPRGSRTSFEMAEVSHPSGRTVLLVNVHAAHKVVHFEQAVSIRIEVSKYLAQRSKRNIDAIIFSGDFNANLFQKNRFSTYNEISTMPWSHSSKLSRESFDLQNSGVFEDLVNRLRDLNRTSDYKPWANLAENDARDRIYNAMYRLKDWQTNFSFRQDSVFEALVRANNTGRCFPRSDIESSCGVDNRIDHIFASNTVRLDTSYVLYPSNSHVDTSGISDHPAVYASFVFK